MNWLMNLLAGLGSVALVILGISLLILAHEFGHFIVAKLTGIKVDEFMLGFPGPKIFSFKIGETTYGATFLFIGGYVKYAGMDPFERVTDESDERGFNIQPAWKKILCVVMGPVMNLVLCAVLLTVVLTLHGIWLPTTVIDKTLPKYPARRAGLKSGDKIVAINGKRIASWSNITENVQPNPGKKVDIEIERKYKKLSFEISLAERDDKGFLGIQPKNEKEKQPLLVASWNALKMTGQSAVAICKFLYVTFTQKISLLRKGARGPVGIVVETHRAASRGIFDFIFLLALLSVSLAVFNAFPIPPLDGGRLLMLGIESIRRKPINEKVIIATNATGVALLLFLMVYLVVADVQRYILPQLFPGM